MKQLRHCPCCLSENVDRIVYGLPAGPQSPDDHVRLGGCCIMVGESPDYHCNSCGNQWSIGESSTGRHRAITDGAADAYAGLSTVEAWVGGFPGPSYRVVIDLQTGLSTWTGERHDAPMKQEPVVKHLTQAETVEFLKQLRDVDPLALESPLQPTQHRRRHALERHDHRLFLSEVGVGESASDQEHA